MKSFLTAAQVFSFVVFSAVLPAQVVRPELTGKIYPAYAPDKKLAGDLRFVGESSAEPLFTLWVDGFKAPQPGVKVFVKSTSPLAALPTVASGAYDIGFPARELWPYEEELFQKARGYAPTVVLVGVGAHRTAGLTPALGVFVHASNPLARITLDQLDSIYSDARRRGGKAAFVTWGDLGATGEWAARPIRAYTHRLPNGIDYFIQKTVMRGADFKRTVIELPMRRGDLGPDEVIAEAVARDPAAIGFAGFGAVTAAVKTLALAETARGPFFAGMLEEVATLRYPFSRPIYIVIDRPPGQPVAPKIAEFLRYVLSAPGQNVFAASGGWLPLPPELAHAELAKLR